MHQRKITFHSNKKPYFKDYSILASEDKLSESKTTRKPGHIVKFRYENNHRSKSESDSASNKHHSGKSF